MHIVSEGIGLLIRWIFLSFFEVVWCTLEKVGAVLMLIFLNGKNSQGHCCDNKFTVAQWTESGIGQCVCQKDGMDVGWYHFVVILGGRRGFWQLGLAQPFVWKIARNISSVDGAIFARNGCCSACPSKLRDRQNQNLKAWYVRYDQPSRLCRSMEDVLFSSVCHVSWWIRF